MGQHEAAAAPDVRLTQLSNSGVGDVADSLNLFRGDVNLPLPLVALRGRNGLDVALTAFYASNVDPAVQPSNRAAPTGPLGVGWSLPRERVVLEPGPSGAADFFLVVGGAPRRLVRRATATTDEYELLDYQFWTISRHRDELDPENDRWTIVREDGATYVYGRGGIEWGVRWDNWTGTGVAPGGQRYPVAWNLVSVTSAAGDSISFEYEREDVPIDGAGGPAYTRACYLNAITDSYGQRVTLRYAEKEPFEVVPPHPTQPGAPQAFQDRYESRFLDRVDVTVDDGSALFSVQLDYQFLDVSRSGVSPGAGDEFRKRYLTGVTEIGRAGIAIPSLSIEYCADPDDPNPGGVQQLTYPRGAVVRYEYATEPLPNSATRHWAPSPGPGYQPRVWHGPGYTVVTWHNPTAVEMRIDAYTWNGHWNAWSDTKNWSVADTSLRVYAAVGFYAVSFTDARTGAHRVLLYRQDPYRSGEWSLVPHQIELPAGEPEPLVRLGEDFVAIADTVGQRLVVADWNLESQAWIEHEFSTLDADHLSLACTPDACVLGCYEDATSTLRLAMHHRVASGDWVRSDVLDEPLTVDWQLTHPAGLVGVGATFAAVSFVSGLDEQTGDVSYGVRLIPWRSDYTFGNVLRHDASQSVTVANPIGATGISDSTVGNAQHLFRFDGRQWQVTDLVTPDASDRYGYAYGSDVAVVAVSADGPGVTYRRASYDPYSGQWSPPTAIGESEAAAAASVSGDILIAGREIQRRTPTLDWEPILQLPGSADPTTVANRAPVYVAWQDAAVDADAAQVITFDADGRPQPGHRLDSESYFVANPEPGQLLAGPEVLVTFRGSSLATASGLALYRIIEARVDARMADRAVTRASIDDGFAVAPVTVAYDRSTATFDPYARVAQYVKVRLYRGEPDSAPGYVESVYFNGLRPDVPGVVYPPPNEFNNATQFFAKLSGQLYEQTAVDVSGRPVSRARTDLFTYDRSNSDASCLGSYTRRRRGRSAQSLHLFDSDPAFAADLDELRLPSGLRTRLADAGLPVSDPVTVTAVDRGRLWTVTDPSASEFIVVLEEGRLSVYGWITDVSEFGYNARGQLSRTSTANVDSTGTPTRQLTLITFAWEVYPELAARHRYDLAAEKRVIDQATSTVVSSAVTTYRDDWPSAPGVWCWHKTYQWKGDAEASVFDFAGWSGDDEPDPDWVPTDQVLDVTARGLPLATADIGGNVGGTSYDRTGRFPVAVFALADPTIGEAGWYGFEEYEDPAGWQLTPDGTDPGGYITEGDAFTGLRRLAIPGDPDARIGLRRTFTAGSGADAGADGRPYLLSAWYKTGPGFVTDAELAGWQLQVANGDPVVVPAEATDGTWRYFHHVVTGAQPGDQITVEVFSRQDGHELLVDAISFAPLHGRCTATVYDPVDRLPVATVDGTGAVERFGYDRLRRPILTVRDGQPVDSAAEYLWRSRDSQGTVIGDPNANLALSCHAQGEYTDFRHGDEWTRVWDASAGWQVRDGHLSYEGAPTAGTLTLRAGDDRRGYGVHAALANDPVVQGTIGFAFGASFTAQWSDGTWQLLDADGQVTDQTDDPVFDYGSLLLLTTGQTILLAADGRVVLRGTLPDEPSGAVTLLTDQPLTLPWIAVCGGPVAAIEYADNAGQVRQTQLVGDGQILVSGWGYDELGRAHLASRQVCLDGGPGYRPDLLAELDPATGQMFDCELTRAYPEDEGYPFHRIRFEASPVGQAVESGGPGAALAINPAVPEAERHTTRMRFGLNVSDPAFGLPAGQYRSTVVIDPDGVPSTRWTDRAGALVATHAGHGDAQVRSQLRYDARGALTEIRQPNFFDTALPGRERFVTTLDNDTQGRPVRAGGPDLDGTVATVYDRAGRVRFHLMPQQAIDGELSYRRYDRLGRLVEQGTCQAEWQEPELREHADEPDWLPGPARWHLRYEFDGDGTDLGLLGRPHRTLVGGPDGEPAVTTTLRYDQAGRVAESVLTVEGAGAEEYRIGYAYDLTGKTTSMRYPGDGVTVDYRYDRFGRVAGVAVTGPDGQRRDIAAYTYRADGLVETETLLSDDAAELVRRYQHTSAGWLTEVADRHLVETADYFTGGFDGAGSYSGRVSRFASRFTGVDDPAFLTEHHYEYAYDALGRLRTALAGPDGTASIGDRVPLRYDLNGNLQVLQRGDGEQQFTYQDGENRLRRVAEASAPPLREFTFTADGDLSSMTGPGAADFSYDAVTGLVTRIDNGHVTTLDYQYDGAGSRVLASGPDGVRLTVPSAGGGALLLERDGTAREYLIPGPLGLLAVYRDGEVQHLLQGRLGSTRALWDGSGLVAAYNYQPFGDLLGPAFRRPGAVDLPYLFTGAEFDPATGLYNLGVRLYDPTTGRMISTDPAGQYPSPYLYAGADPINLFDPTGAFAWSWEAFGAVLGGLVVAALGLLATVVTAGAATPLLVLGILGGGALIGAGLASAAYGFVHADGEASRFDVAQWGVTVGLGAGFGMASAGFGMMLTPLASTIGTLGMLGAETAIGVGMGVLDSLATNAAFNSMAGQPALDNVGTAAWMGAVTGGFGGLLGGVLGRGTMVRTNLTVRRGLAAGNPASVEVVNQTGRRFVGHTVVGADSVAHPTWYSHSYRDWTHGHRVIGPSQSALNARLANNLPAVRISAEQNVADTMFTHFTNRTTQNDGAFVFLFRDCTAWGKEVLRQGGLHAPIWTANPGLLKLWARTLGQSV